MPVAPYRRYEGDEEWLQLSLNLKFDNTTSLLMCRKFLDSLPDMSLTRLDRLPGRHRRVTRTVTGRFRSNHVHYTNS